MDCVYSTSCTLSNWRRAYAYIAKKDIVEYEYCSHESLGFGCFEDPGVSGKGETVWTQCFGCCEDPIVPATGESG